MWNNKNPHIPMMEMFFTLEKYLAESIKVKHTHILWYTNSTPKDILSRKSHMPTKRYLQEVNSSITTKKQKQPKCPQTKVWINKLWYFQMKIPTQQWKWAKYTQWKNRDRSHSNALSIAQSII